jgi:plasmid stabilization system protein ParE
MAKRKINWSTKANLGRKEILEYWVNRNKSKDYSIKLNNLFLESLKKIASNPFIGKETQIENIRIKNSKDYLIIYEFNDNQVKVLTLWSTFRDESKLTF